jgi:hypothetical protein
MLGFPLDSVYSHSPAGNPAQALPAQGSLRLATKCCEKCGLEFLNDRFTFETVDVGGDPITFQGKITKKGVLMWIGQEEGDHLVTFHLTGALKDGDGLVASGKVSIFKDHESATGEWQLKKAN